MTIIRFRFSFPISIYWRWYVTMTVIGGGDDYLISIYWWWYDIRFRFIDVADGDWWLVIGDADADADRFIDGDTIFVFDLLTMTGSE